MRIRVIEDRCQGHTLCAMAAPSLIELRDEDGHARAVEGEIDPALHAAAERAAAGCPERAIELLDR
jgi:ferredoxin